MRKIWLAGILAALIGSAAWAQQPVLLETNVGGVPTPVSTTNPISINSESTKATYDASVLISVTGATVNDLCAMPGSATKVVRMLNTSITMMSSSASMLLPKLVKRSAVSTGTAGTAMTAVPRDASFAAATAAPVSWGDSSAQVPGASVGNIQATIYMSVAAAATAGEQPAPLMYRFGPGDNSSAVVLRAVAQQVTWNLGAAPPAGFQVECHFTWTEE